MATPVLLLPGMDGTGLLFEPFIAREPKGIHAKPIPLQQAPNLGYAEQAEHVLAQMDGKATVVVAESYSGRIAYEIALRAPENIKHLFFAASFLNRPSVFARIASLLPLYPLRNSWIPDAVFNYFAFGRSRPGKTAQLLNESLTMVDSSVLKYRLKQVSELEAPKNPITVPCTYIRAENDKLVSPKAISVFKAVCPDLAIREVDGGHFILQSNPTKCWKLIGDILQHLDG